MICATSGIFGLILDACQGDNGGPLIREVSTTQGCVDKTYSFKFEGKTAKFFRNQKTIKIKKLFTIFKFAQKLLVL